MSVVLGTVPRFCVKLYGGKGENLSGFGGACPGTEGGEVRCGPGGCFLFPNCGAHIRVESAGKKKKGEEWCFMGVGGQALRMCDERCE